jgi:hypothetical protein
MEHGIWNMEHEHGHDGHRDAGYLRMHGSSMETTASLEQPSTRIIYLCKKKRKKTAKQITKKRLILSPASFVTWASDIPVLRTKFDVRRTDFWQSNACTLVHLLWCLPLYSFAPSPSFSFVELGWLWLVMCLCLPFRPSQRPL